MTSAKKEAFKIAQNKISIHVYAENSFPEYILEEGAEDLTGPKITRAVCGQEDIIIQIMSDVPLWQPEAEEHL